MPRFSIIVPTRERAQTLGPCLKTCLDEPYSDVEFVVHDNASTDGTKALVEGLNDPRIRYFRTPERVSMRLNFEAAVRQARGDYLIMFGDDDGLIPGALERLDRATRAGDYDFIAWPTVDYLWPGVDPQRPGHVRLRRRNMFRPAMEVDLDARRHDLFNAVPISYRETPKIYHGCISRGLIDRLLQYSDVLFQYDIPDVYAQIAFLVEARRGLSLGHVLTINGASKNSNGTSAFGHAHKTIERYDGTAYGVFMKETRTDLASPIPYNPAIISIQYYTYVCLNILEHVLKRGLPINHDAWLKAVHESLVANPNFDSIARSAQALSAIDQKILSALAEQSAQPLSVPSGGDPLKATSRKSRRSEHILATGSNTGDTVAEAAAVLKTIGDFSDRQEQLGWQASQMLRWMRLIVAERHRTIE